MRRNNPDPDPGIGDLDAIELKAADWLVQRERGLGSWQRWRFDRWLKADARHAHAFARLDQTWGLLDRVPADSLPLPPYRKSNNRGTALALAAAAALALVFLGAGGLARREPATVARVASTPVGGLEKIDLPDGSMVRLNTATQLEFAFTATERRVRLIAGEASFEVARDRARPFIVRVGQVDVRAVGTAFNIRLNSATIDVLVTEGRVSVDDTASGRTLLPEVARSSDSPTPPVARAGQRVTIPIVPDQLASVGRLVPIPADESARTLAWQNRRLEFSAESLAKIVAEFNRYNRHQLVLADAQLGAQRFGGKFPTHDFEALLRLLEANFAVVVERGTTQTILRRTGDPASRP